MKVWILDNGSIVIEHTQLMWNVPGPQVRIPSYAVLIEHDDGLFLFDTGFDLEHTNAVLPFELPEQTPEQTIPAQLELAGFAVSDVTTLVNSHLHFDHVGGNKHFAGLKNVVHEQELAQARHHEPFEFFGYSDKTWDYEGANFE
ncbi:MAG: MBL fold metallo-hydrolase, partial [Thermoleophilia bacterium]|nr:MBL fold metallo-hydrolase [Thermoleophilia bacterium]